MRADSTQAVLYSGMHGDPVWDVNFANMSLDLLADLLPTPHLPGWIFLLSR